MLDCTKLSVSRQRYLPLMFAALAYMNRTITLPPKAVSKCLGKPTQLFLSWATQKPVTKETILHWLIMTLAMAGIDTAQFKAHSYRGAGLSGAHAKGATVC